MDRGRKRELVKKGIYGSEQSLCYIKERKRKTRRADVDSTSFQTQADNEQV